MIKKTTEQFISEAKLIHKNKYDYSLVEYKNNSTKVKIICPIHGMFEQRPSDHLNNHGCKKCGIEKVALSNTKTTEQFISEAKLIHKNKYDYSLVEYINDSTNVKIICSVHGVFEQTPNNHLTGKGCKYCANNIIKTTEQFVSEAKLIHKNKYDYSLVEYISSKIPVKIKCNTCNKVFEQYPDKHINAKQGCRYCSSSKGEEKILNWLEQNNKIYKHIKKYDDLIDINQLSYDFYLPKHNLLVEYNGVQHYQYDSYFHKTLHDFHRQLHHDWLKRKYARNQNINLLVIPYWEFDNIENILLSNII